MSFRMHHAHERLGRAIKDLATRPGTLRERVIDVYFEHLLVLSTNEFDGEARRDYEQIMEMLSGIIDRVVANPEPWNVELHGGPAQIAKNKIRERTAQKLAVAIWELYSGVNDNLISDLVE